MRRRVQESEGFAPKAGLAGKEPLPESIRYTFRGRDWARISDDELAAFAQEFVDGNGIKNRLGLAKKDPGLCRTLRRRGLLGWICFEKSKRAFGDDSELLELARSYVKSEGIESRRGLEKADISMYYALLRRGLLDAVSFERGRRSWDTEQDILQFAEKIIKDKGIQSSRKLEEEDSGLVQALRKRGLLRSLGLKMKPRPRTWDSDRELLEYARRQIEEMGIRGRHWLEKADSGLYQALRYRKLLDAVFSRAESENRKDAVDAVINAAETFDK